MRLCILALRNLMVCNLVQCNGGGRFIALSFAAPLTLTDYNFSYVFATSFS